MKKPTTQHNGGPAVVEDAGTAEPHPLYGGMNVADTNGTAPDAEKPHGEIAWECAGEALDLETLTTPYIDAMMAKSDMDVVCSALVNLIDEWQERDGKIYSVAIAGWKWINHDGDLVAQSLFDIIQDHTTDTTYASELRAGVVRLCAMLKQAEANRG